MNDLDELTKALQQLVGNVAPAQRRTMARKVAQELRRTQQARIRRQQNADGTPYPARSPKTKTTQQRLRFIYFGEVRDLKNWAQEHDRVTGWDNKRGAIRTFLRDRIERYLAVDTASTTRKKPRAQPMFRRLRTASFLRATGTADAATVGYDGVAALIARVHQYGLQDQVAPNVTVRYPLRELLGVTPADRETVMDIIFDIIAEQ